MVFNIGIYYIMGEVKARQFLLGYVVEKALSVDNLFVFLVIFNFYRVPEKYQHKVLFWGILVAIILRGVCIALGQALIAQFAWVMFIFGAFLIYTGFKLLQDDSEHFDPAGHWSVRLMKRFLPVTSDYHGEKFFVVLEGVKTATPLFVVLMLINVIDVVFAVDSIPAIFGIVKDDPFIVYTSNIFAIFGLRALYFALAALTHLFAYLKYGLSAILIFIGVKMLYNEGMHYGLDKILGESFPHKVEEVWSLVVVLGLLAVSIIASIVFPPPKHVEAEDVVGVDTSSDEPTKDAL